MKKIHVGNLLSKILITSLISINYCSATDLGSVKSTISKNLTDRSPSKIVVEDVNETQISGLYEVKFNGTEILYSDSKGEFILQGSLINTSTNKNLTEEKIAKLSAVDFKLLPFADSFAIIRGNGKRRIAIFEDPNCGYCKKLEVDLLKLDNVTINIFLNPILGADSLTKATAIWCSPDRVKSWQDWMIRGIQPKGAACEVKALDRNNDFGRRHKITGTPTMLFEDGTRFPGVVEIEKIEKVFSGIKK